MAKKKDSKKSKKDKKQLYWILGAVIILVAVFYMSSAFFKNLSQVEYEGLVFAKEKFGEIPVFHYYYYFNGDNGDVIKYNLYLRNDPSKNKVPITGSAIFERGEIVYLSIDDTDLQQCEYASVGISSLAQFLSGNLLELRSAVQDPVVAEENNLRHVTCETNPNNKVILFQAGEETRVDRDDLCHTISINNCEVLEAIEKYQVQSVVEARERAIARTS
ncbi:MAG: hypothetical protein CL811_12880 [Colwelliaceae bacterium]|nr:hypothetical protein [Colwelliaceae bacterium]|tara:strand:+ start:1172 stop:1825 length:654 start_codon:yes stop_codon:yes gene_type:complete